MVTFHLFENSIPDEAKALRLIGMPVSALDHWLTENEFINTTPFLSYREARDKGHAADYLQMEDRFLELLDGLSKGGVSLIRFPDRLQWVSPTSSRWRSILRRGLRYKFSDELYFHQYEARFLFGWDLTHWFIFRERRNATAVADLVRKAGLHILELHPSVVVAD